MSKDGNNIRIQDISRSIGEDNVLGSTALGTSLRYDANSTGKVNFQDVLSELLPWAGPAQLAEMARDASPVPLQRKHIEKLQMFFENCCEPFSVQCPVSTAVRECSYHPVYARYVRDVSDKNKMELKEVNFQQFLKIVFGHTHPRQFKEIMRWSPPSEENPFTETQKAEVQLRFKTFSKGKNSIPLIELRSYLKEIGFDDIEAHKILESYKLAGKDPLNLRDFISFCRQYIFASAHH